MSSCMAMRLANYGGGKIWVSDMLNFDSTKNRFADFMRASQNSANEIHAINLHRAFYAAMIAVPVELLHLIYFGLLVPDGPIEAAWRAGILIAHTFILVLFLACGAASHFLSQREEVSELGNLVPSVLVAAVLAAGVMIVVIDQQVTTNITPFLIVCTIAGLVFLLRPAVSLALYFAAYGAFYVAMGYAQTNTAILATNRVNGATIVAMGICLSMILWQAAIRNIELAHQIEKQNRVLEEQNKQLEYLASHDHLTGLYNRSEFCLLTEREAARMRRIGYDSSIIMTDIDEFKTINDQYGHPVGDVVLQQFSEILVSQVREIDVVARWGGEEFIMLLPSTPFDEAVLVAERIRGAVERAVFVAGGAEIHITSSFGVTALSDIQSEAFCGHYEVVDRALYRAKELGRNRVEVSQPLSITQVGQDVVD